MREEPMGEGVPGSPRTDPDWIGVGVLVYQSPVSKGTHGVVSSHHESPVGTRLPYGERV